MPFLLIACIFLQFSSMGQTGTVEQLRSNIRNSEESDDKLQALFALCDLGYNLHPDTLILYANEAQQLSAATHNEHGKLVALFHISCALTTKGLIDSSLQVANSCLQKLKALMPDAELEAKLYNQIGRCYMRKSRYKDAIGMGFKVIATAEHSGNVLMQVKGKTLLGWAYLEMGRSNVALKWHLAALHTTTDTAVLHEYAILYANIALNYRGLNKMDSAFYYIDNAILYSRLHENLFALSNSLAIKAQLLAATGKGPEAEASLKEVVQIRQLIGDPFYVVSDMSQLAFYYAKNGQPKEGIAISKEGIAIAQRFHLDTKLLFLYSSLAENYKAAHDYKNYSEVMEKIIAIKDSTNNANPPALLAEMQSKYELQRRENIIIQQQLKLVEKNYLVYSALLLLVVGGVLSYLLFKSYKRRQAMKLDLMMEEEKRVSSLAVLRAEENERKRIAADLHDNIGAYASAISANVDELLGSHTNDIHVLKAMKKNASEIMSNLRDTIWAMNKEAILLTGISDRFKTYVQNIGKSYDTIQVQITERIENNVSLSPERSLHMLRIMQEAFHNAVKHSRCMHIHVHIQSAQHIHIVISDDGIGMDTILEDSAETAGYGLHNMYRRARQCGWKLVINSMVPAGTEVQLTT